MGCGVSYGEGQSSLGYLFGDGEPPKVASNKEEAPKNQGPIQSNDASQKPTGPSPPVDVSKQIPAGIQGNKANNNYLHVDGQNTSNFIKDRLSTKVHAAPGVDLRLITCLEVAAATNFALVLYTLINDCSTFQVGAEQYSIFYML